MSCPHAEQWGARSHPAASSARSPHSGQYGPKPCSNRSSHAGQIKSGVMSIRTKKRPKQMKNAVTGRRRWSFGVIAPITASTIVITPRQMFSQYVRRTRFAVGSNLSRKHAARRASSPRRNALACAQALSDTFERISRTVSLPAPEFHRRVLHVPDHTGCDGIRRNPGGGGWVAFESSVDCRQSSGTCRCGRTNLPR